MKTNHKILLSGILAITLLVYFQTFYFDFVNWDDDFYVINNLQVTNPSLENILLFFTQGNTANYHPVTMLSLTLNYVLGGENALGYHIFNLIFHLFNSILLYLWVKKLWPDKQLLPFLIAGVFALHPMHVESVAWISSRKDVLFFFFYFLGLLNYHTYIKCKKTKHLLITLLFFVLSALSKPTAVIFPIHLLLVDYLFERKFVFRLVLEKIPFILISILVGLATVYVQNDAGAVNIDAYSFIERIQLASYAINLYVVKFLFPISLSSFYPYPFRPFDTIVTLAPVFLLIIGGLTIWRLRANRNVVFSVFFFLISLILLVQLVTVGSTIISERYTYLAYIGLSLGLFFIVEHFFSKTIDFNDTKVFGMIVVLLIVFSLVSFNRIKVWKNGETLWTDAIKKFPEVAGSWGGRGVYYRLKKNYTKALSDLNQAVRLNPNEPMFYSNRGNIYFDLGKDSKALFDYNNCLRLDASDVNALANRGAIYGRKKAYDKAITDLNDAIKLKPDFVTAYMNRGIIHSQMNEHEKSKSDFRKCLEMEIENDEIWNALAVEHQHLGEFEASIIVLDTVIDLRPNIGVYYLNRGISFRLLGNQTSANLDFDQARKLGVEVNLGYYEPIH
ncbi:MAG: tetratricopeptide repeat protein [Algibacter sp.]